MAGVTLTVNAGDKRAIEDQLARVTAFIGSPRPLLKAWGLRTLKYIDDTFQAGGRPAWKPLQPRTLAGRRDAGKGALTLQRNGDLRRSFKLLEEADLHVTLGSDEPTAVWQHYGTKGPYEIRAKHAKALAIPGLGGAYSQRGFAGGRPTGRGSFTVGAGGTVRGRRPGQVAVPYTKVEFYQKVTHPGLPARPILPTEEQIVPELEKVGAEVLRRVAEGK